MWNRNKNAESHQNVSEKSADDDYESMPIDSNDAENRFEHAQVQIITSFINSDWKMTEQKKNIANILEDNAKMKDFIRKKYV